MSKNKKAESIKELCNKYDNLIPASKLEVKVPLLGEANCNK